MALSHLLDTTPPRLGHLQARRRLAASHNVARDHPAISMLWQKTSTPTTEMIL